MKLPPPHQSQGPYFIRPMISNPPRQEYASDFLRGVVVGVILGVAPLVAIIALLRAA